MIVDIVSKGIVYIHLFIVALMAIAGFPQIMIYISLLWGACCYVAIPLCEDQFIWKNRHIFGLGILYFLNL